MVSEQIINDEIDSSPSQQIIKNSIFTKSHGRAICVDQETGLLANLEDSAELSTDSKKITAKHNIQLYRKY